MKPELSQAARILRRDGVVAFPTETVYGLGARLSSERAVRKVYRVKGRPSDNPLIVHVATFQQFRALTRDLPKEAWALAAAFWPGPLTLVCRKSQAVPETVTAGLETVAIRMPNHRLARALIRAAGEPIAAPSANRSGRPSPTRFDDVRNELEGRADLILRGGDSRVGLESTVVDVTQRPFRILRPGFISVEQLRAVVPDVRAWKGAVRGAAKSPGMKHRHYQPACKVVMVRPELWQKSVRDWTRRSLRLGVLSYTQAIPQAANICLRRRFRGQEQYARHLYSGFFEAERKKVDVLLVESPQAQGVGLALMDRLSRASS